MKGFSKCCNKILFSQDLDPISKLVYTSLNFYTRNGVGECFARKTTLAKMLNISLYQLRKALYQLEQLKLINIERRGQGHPDTITLIDLKARSAYSSTLHTLYKEEKVEEEYSPSSEDVFETTTASDNTSQDAPDTPEPTTTPIPDTILKEPTDRVRATLRGHMRQSTYNQYFKDISVIAEDESSITLITDAGQVVADFIQNVFVDTLQKLLGKSVCVMAEVATLQ
jgi:hypothetical protein